LTAIVPPVPLVPRVGVAGDGTDAKSEVRVLLWLLLQAGFVLALIVGLRIENQAFYTRVAPLAILGAMVNHLLPMRYRLKFFALLSVLGLILVFGMTQGAWILGIGLLFILLCHLPVPRPLRVVLILMVGTGLGLMRAEVLPTPWATAIWPIVGSMLMFRLIIYLYDLPHLKQRATWEERVAYFFCLPNVVFPLFPVLDFSTFRRTYYDRPAAGIYQEGIHWILRGLLHLVGYRLLYEYGHASPADVRTGTDLIGYVISNYGLYLRVSGQFHLIIGMLHLFGFRLPETHRFFFLAANFSDLWRRINIYWKDFMQKVFYQPVFFRLRRHRSETFALLVSTITVFVATWFLHSYQWFWLLGTWLFSATDAIFWGLLGCCLVLNLLYESRKGRVRTVGASAAGPGARIRLAAQTVAMFTFMALLWAFWTSPTISGFVEMLRQATFGVKDLGTLAATWLVLGVIAHGLQARIHVPLGRTQLSPRGGAVASACLAVAMVGHFVPVDLPNPVADVLATARRSQLNRRDTEGMERGYYERIVGVHRFNNDLWRVYSMRPAEWGRLDETAAVRRTEDDRLVELVAGVVLPDFHGARLTVSSGGLRDREYAIAKPAGTFRVVVMGQSYVLGEGVRDNETFENLLEDRLNAGESGALPPLTIEILNLAVPAYGALQQLADLELGRVAAWQPDLVLAVGHARELVQLEAYFDSYLSRREPSAWSPRLARWIAEMELAPGLELDAIRQQLDPHRTTILAEAYAGIVDQVRGLGAVPVFAYIPTPDTAVDPGQLKRYLAVVTAAGFDTMLDMRDVYADELEERLVVAEWDHHPNARGHQIIADRLYLELTSRPDLFRRTVPGSRAP